MSFTTSGNGQLCNQIIRNLALSLIAEKNNLYVTYSNFDKINNKLGIILFVGKNKYHNTEIIGGGDYMEYFQSKSAIKCNLNFMHGYFQNKQITNILYNHLRLNKKHIMDKNPYKFRYKNNNDVFLHIRLTDAVDFNPGMNYYDKCINIIVNEYDNIYIGSDDFNHILIKKLKKKYPKIIFIEKDPINTIQFGSTCKYVILSHGSFSAVIGYLAFFSKIYYPDYKPKWCPLGMYLDKGFIGVTPSPEETVTPTPTPSL
mgnify:CR=1 FL=1